DAARPGRHDEPREEARMLGIRRKLASGSSAGRRCPAITPIMFAAALVPAAAPAVASGQQDEAAAGAMARPAPDRSGHVEANGVSYYYEIHGQGEPLLLLHGGLGSIDMFGPVLPALAASRQVIAVDLHGHGRTALGDRPISLVDMGD